MAAGLTDRIWDVQEMLYVDHRLKLGMPADATLKNHSGKWR